MSATQYGRLDQKNKPSIRLSIPPDPRYARTVRDAIIGFAGLHGVGTGDLEAFLFAVGEALANAIEHSRTTLDIEVLTEIDAKEIVATVTDYGAGFGHPPRDLVPLPNPLSERGRGIPIMQRFADVFEVQPRPEGGTIVTLGRLRRERFQESTAAS